MPKSKTPPPISHLGVHSNSLYSFSKNSFPAYSYILSKSLAEKPIVSESAIFK